MNRKIRYICLLACAVMIGCGDRLTIKQQSEKVTKIVENSIENLYELNELMIYGKNREAYLLCKIMIEDNEKIERMVKNMRKDIVKSSMSSERKEYLIISADKILSLNEERITENRYTMEKLKRKLSN